MYELMNAKKKAPWKRKVYYHTNTQSQTKLKIKIKN